MDQDMLADEVFSAPFRGWHRRTAPPKPRDAPTMLVVAPADQIITGQQCHHRAIVQRLGIIGPDRDGAGEIALSLGDASELQQRQAAIIIGLNVIRF